MIPYKTLKELVIETIKTSGNNFQFNGIRDHAITLIKDRNIGPIDERVRLDINQIVWDLVIERIITFGTESGSEPKWPFIRLTEFGKEVINNSNYCMYDPDNYIKDIQNIVKDLDPIIKQYTYESFRSYRFSLYFSAGVMIGAAAERSILMLLQSIMEFEKNTKKVLQIKKLIERPNLGMIYGIVTDTINELIKTKQIPYSVHEGCILHLMSFFEMIRVQRNESVHPQIVNMNKTKVLLSLKTFPEGLRIINRLINWFEENKSE